MSVLVIAEHDNNVLKSATASAVTAALSFGEEVHLLVAGWQCQKVSHDASHLEGVFKVLVAEAEHYEHQIAEELTEAMLPIARHYTAIVAPSTTFGKNLLPRLAALLDVQPIADVIAIEAPDTFKRPIYAGNVVATVQSHDDIKVLTVRPTAFAQAPMGEVMTLLEPLTPIPPHNLVKFEREQLAEADRPELAGAKIVVSGGRALGSSENFELVYALADVLGAAVGASRAAVDAGFVPNDLQVGQTGKIVAPDLYLAVGISGAIQHLAGMKESKVIVAINKDEDAPIFQVADYGLAADLFTAVPELTQKLKERM